MFSTNVGGIAGPQPGDIWTVRSMPGIRMAASPSGANVALTYSFNGVTISTNGGATYTTRSVAASQDVQDVAMSDDGQKIYVACQARDGGFNLIASTVYRSADGGATWASTGTSQLWARIACSADGTVVHVARFAGSSAFYTSTDSGVTWTLRTLPVGYYANGVLACSADGQRVFAAGFGAALAISTDYGATWATQTLPASITDLKCSDNGLTVLATLATAQLQVSTNGGTTWAARDAARNWTGAAVNADGQRMAACVGSGLVYFSTDGGSTWGARGPAKAWQQVALSADGLWVGATASTLHTSTGEY